MCSRLPDPATGQCPRTRSPQHYAAWATETGTVTGHGFRATARTILDEVLGFRPDIIEHQLAHEVRDPNGRSYNRTSHLPERRKMMQEWADYLDKLRTQPAKSI